jgi:hypothetical protein
MRLTIIGLCNACLPILLAFTLTGCHSTSQRTAADRTHPAAERPNDDGRAKADPAVEPIDVSMVQLIATPERFDGKPIRVIGFLHLEFEGNALYLHETDFCHSISANAIWVGVGWPPDDKYVARSNSYVLLEGVFDARSKGHMSMFAGSVRNVTRLEGWNVDAEPHRCDPRIYTWTLPSPPGGVRQASTRLSACLLY